MNEIEKIQRYIDKTAVYNRVQFDINFHDAEVISQLGPLDAVCLAFQYGQAKGYRAAKTEERRKTANKEDTTNVR